MSFDFASALQGMRRVVHQTLGFEALYSHPSRVGTATLTVRWHTRVAVGGDLGDAGYMQLIDGVNRVHFDRDELAEQGVVLDTGGTLTFTHESLQGIVLSLGEQEHIDGPVGVTWSVGQVT